MHLIPDIEESVDALRALRRDLHAHPELAYDEHRTAGLIADELTRLGLDVQRGIGRTGVVGTLRAGGGSAAIGLRADMDALPINEKNAFAHRSVHAGRMHACGHDGHVAMLLGAARYLARHRHFDGTVHFIFQPAEEGGAGASAMIKDGLFERFPVDAVFGLHNWPGMRAGSFGVCAGPIMASSNEFKITVIGTGSHAALPHMGHDPVFAAVQIASALQGVITRNKRPLDAAVLSITQIHAGEASNIVPSEAWLGGTVRTFSAETLDVIEAAMRRVAEGTALALGCTVNFSFHRNYPPTINSAPEAALAASVMQAIVGEQNVEWPVDPTMGAEDFSFMLRERPGCYAFIGNGEGAHREISHGAGPCTLHNASYDFNDEILSLGSTYWVKLVERFLTADTAHTAARAAAPEAEMALLGHSS
ncbi:MAG: M20 aminoacylase family protein [Janthinobacterium lividum]